MIVVCSSAMMCLKIDIFSAYNYTLSQAQATAPRLPAAATTITACLYYLFIQDATMVSLD